MLGQIRHKACHDLEALFWVIWIVSVNSNGPYDTRREWQDHLELPAHSGDDSATHGAPTPDGPVHQLTQPTLSALRGGLRMPADAVAVEQKGVPVWATPGLHEFSAEDVFDFKRDIPVLKFLDSMSPYWSDGMAGQVFKDGMLELRELLVWHDSEAPPPVTVTHDKFVSILAKMRDAIPAEEDRATTQEVTEARARYDALLQMGGELGTSLLDVPVKPLILQRQSSRKSTSRIAAFPTAARLTSSKRKADPLPSEQRSESSSKRPRVAEKNGGPRRPTSPQGRGRRTARSGDATGSTVTSTPTNTSPSRPRTRRTASTPAPASMSPPRTRLSTTGARQLRSSQKR